MKDLAKQRQPALGFIFVTIVLDMIGIGIIIPILPKLIEHFTKGKTDEASTIYGLLAAVYALMQFVFAPVLGSLSDRFGRRPVILGSLFGAGIDYLFLAIAPSVGWFFIGRIVAGITGANITAVSAYIADVSPPEKRAQNFGLLGAAFGLGFIAGPALGGVLGNIDLRLPFFVAAIITLINWLYGFFVLPESLKKENRRPFSWAMANPIGTLGVLARYPVVFALTWTFFFISLAQMVMQNVWVLYTSYRYGWQPNETGISLTIVGITFAIVQAGLIQMAIKRLGDQKAIIVGETIATISFILYGLAPQGWMMYVIIVFASLGAIAGPAAQGFISKNVPDDEQGLVQGALTSLNSITGIVGPIIGTSIFSFFIAKTNPVQLPGAPFFLSAVFIVIGLSFAIRAFRRINIQSAKSSED